MSFDMPQDVILPLDTISVRFDPAPHPFELAHRAAAQENWVRERAANPALFDGRVMLLSELAVRGQELRGRCHEVAYSTFLHWRRNRAPGAQHAFAHAMLVSGDDALIAIRMGHHTLNAGSVYFAAGSFEPQDIVEGLVDVEANTEREVREETGLDISAAPREAHWHALSTPAGTVLFRRYFLDRDAETLAAAIRAHVAAEAEPEIEGPVVIGRGAPAPDGLKPHMPRLIDWHFGGGK